MIRCETVGILQVRKVLLVRVRDALLAEYVRKVEVQRIDLELLSGKQRYLDMDLASLKNMHDAPTSRRGGIGNAGRLFSIESRPCKHLHQKGRIDGSEERMLLRFPIASESTCKKALNSFLLSMR